MAAAENFSIIITSAVYKEPSLLAEIHKGTFFNKKMVFLRKQYSVSQKVTNVE